MYIIYVPKLNINIMKAINMTDIKILINQTFSFSQFINDNNFLCFNFHLYKNMVHLVINVHYFIITLYRNKYCNYLLEY